MRLSLVREPSLIRLCIVTAIITPYRTPVFNELAAYPDIDLHVVYLAEREPNRMWETPWEAMDHAFTVVARDKTLRRHGTYVHSNVLRPAAQVRAFRPNVVIAGGWDQPPHIALFYLRRPFRYRFLWWVESTAKDQRPAGSATAWFKKRLASRADGIIVPGRASSRYVRELGVSPGRISIAPNAVEHDFFVERSRVDRSGRHGSVRVLYLGQLTPVKGVPDLLVAWERLREIDARLVLAGSGPLSDQIQASIANGVLDRVELRGHLERDEIAQELAAADIFVFPSRSDPWGLVVNEATAAGLPVVSTSAPGAVEDLVIHRRNGLVVDPGDSGALADALQTLIKDQEMRVAMGGESAAISDRYTPEACAAGIYQALRHARDPRGTSGGSIP